MSSSHWKIINREHGQYMSKGQKLFDYSHESRVEGKINVENVAAMKNQKGKFPISQVKQYLHNYILEGNT